MDLIDALALVKAEVRECPLCHNLDSSDPCGICAAPNRSSGELCVVADVGDLWAVEKAGVFRGRYFVLGGLLSAFDGIGPDDLHFAQLLRRTADDSELREVILALPATVDGQTTAHYLSALFKDQVPRLRLSRLAQGMPMGGELDYLDEGTLASAFGGRNAV